jgi:N-acetylglucosaminyl-diphospho-decaprenol L-rhamnosyltransferase
MARAAANGKSPKTKAAPAVSVVVVVYESGPTLGECLAALSAQTWRDYEVLLVDNASSDRTAQAAHDADPAIRLIENASNLGFAAAVNQGAKAAKGRWLCSTPTPSPSPNGSRGWWRRLRPTRPSIASPPAS